MYNNKTIKLTQEQETKIISELEMKYIQDCSEKTFKPDIEEQAIRLAKYFRMKGRIEDAQKVLRQFGKNCVEMSKTTAPLVGYAWIKKVYDLYIMFEMKEDADALNQFLKELGEKTRDNLHPISTKIEVSEEEIEEFLTAMTDGGLNKTLKRIAVQFLPKKDKAIKSLRDIAKTTVLTSLITKTIIDDDGRPIAEIGPLEEDIEGNVIQHISNDISFSKIFLHDVFEKMSELYDTSVMSLI